MRYLSVCSGIEAASVAWAPLGWEPWAFAEVDAFPSAVLAHHYPNVPNLGDLTKWKDWPDATLDLLVGGTPCQSFSVAGLRKGLADPRGGLLWSYLAIARRYRPRWVVWENVPGVLSIDGGRAFGSLLGGLAELGYGFAYRVLDAQFFGVAQRRRRVFVVGHLGDWRRAAAVLFERASLSGHPAPRREAGQGSAAAVAPSIVSNGDAHSGFRDAGGLIANSGDIGYCLTASAQQSLDAETETLIAVAHALRGEGFDASEDGTRRGTPVIPIDMRQASRGATMTNNRADGSSGGAPGTGVGEDGDPSPTISTSHPPAVAFDARQSDVINYGDLSGPLDTDGHTIGVLAAVSSGRGWWDKSDVGATIRAQDSVTKADTLAVHGMQVRRLTPRECERLQGFPDDYTLIDYRGKPAADGPRYKALGNSMAVPVMRWIGRRIQMVEATA